MRKVPFIPAVFLAISASGCGRSTITGDGDEIAVMDISTVERVNQDYSLAWTGSEIGVAWGGFGEGQCLTRIGFRE